MDDRRGLRLQTWFWAWRLLCRWTRLNIDPRSLTAGERWAVAVTTLPAALRSRYLRPARLLLLAHTPAWIVADRLQQLTHCWYRIPSQKAADHIRLRFDIWPIDIDDHVRLQQGRLTAVGYRTPMFSEIIFVLPNGELEPDPKNPEMARAWAAHSRIR